MILVLLVEISIVYGLVFPLPCRLDVISGLGDAQLATRPHVGSAAFIQRPFELFYPAFVVRRRHPYII